MKYDKEEQEILEAYESGGMKLSTPSKKEIEAIKAAAKNTFKKDRRITIRLYDHDLQGNSKESPANGCSLSNADFRDYSSLRRRGISIQKG
jgi:predicted DNA binding CopG/RHH family protein